MTRDELAAKISAQMDEMLGWKVWHDPPVGARDDPSVLTPRIIAAAFDRLLRDASFTGDRRVRAEAAFDQMTQRISLEFYDRHTGKRIETLEELHRLSCA